MKYPKLATLLGLQAINIQSGFFGQKSHARLDEEQLNKVEEQLSQESDANLQTKLDDLQSKYDTLNESHTELETANTDLQNAVTAALELNGMKAEVTAETTPTQAVEMLGQKCKEYGSNENRHAFPKNDGQQNNSDDASKNYAHNQVMSDKSKFKILE